MPAPSTIPGAKRRSAIGLPVFLSVLRRTTPRWSAYCRPSTKKRPPTKVPTASAGPEFLAGAVLMKEDSKSLGGGYAAQADGINDRSHLWMAKLNHRHGGSRACGKLAVLVCVPVAAVAHRCEALPVRCGDRGVASAVWRVRCGECGVANTGRPCAAQRYEVVL